ncbi:hypothetical protein BJV82DRAFT_607284 [Fennellomyces sp. T-0311]|nr:hypothetical protein BJV82DRAFT_607284 [Fennellomyces sp. T-0311]
MYHQQYSSNPSSPQWYIDDQSGGYDTLMANSFSERQGSFEGDSIGIPPDALQRKVHYYEHHLNFYPLLFPVRCLPGGRKPCNIQHPGQAKVGNFQYCPAADDTPFQSTGMNEEFDVETGNIGSSFASFQTAEGSSTAVFGTMNTSVPSQPASENNRQKYSVDILYQAERSGNTSLQQGFKGNSVDTSNCCLPQNIMDINHETRAQDEYPESTMDQSTDFNGTSHTKNTHIRSRKRSSSSNFDSEQESRLRKRSISSFESNSGFSDDATDGENDTDGSSVHSQQSIIDNNPKPFACYFPGCLQRFKRLSDVYRHVPKHDTLNNRTIDFTCDICNKKKSYVRKDSIPRHRKTCQEKYNKDGNRVRKWHNEYRKSRL